MKDTGAGIRPDQKEIVFERFRQGTNSLTRNYEGTGLGLSISKAYVEMLNQQNLGFFGLASAIRCQTVDSIKIEQTGDLIKILLQNSLLRQLMDSGAIKKEY